MNDFLKVISGCLVALILGLVLSKQGKDITLILTVAVCCMIAFAAVTYLRPVIGFFERLQNIGNLNQSMLTVLLKAVGIALITQIINLICTDCGNAAMGKTVQMLSTAVILSLSVPLFEHLLDLLNEILGAL